MTPLGIELVTQLKSLMGAQEPPKRLLRSFREILLDVERAGARSTSIHTQIQHSQACNSLYSTPSTAWKSRASGIEALGKMAWSGRGER